MQYHTSLQNTASVYLASAIKLAWPSVILENMGLTAHGFFVTCRVLNSSALLHDLKTLVTEKMRILIKKTPDLHFSEMLAINAAQMCAHYGQFDFVEELESKGQELVWMARSQELNFCAPGEGVPFDFNTSFEILDISWDPDASSQVFKVIGVVFSDSKQLKQFLKIYRKTESCIALAQKNKWILSGYDTWLTRGLYVQKEMQRALLEKAASLDIEMLASFNDRLVPQDAMADIASALSVKKIGAVGTGKVECFKDWGILNKNIVHTDQFLFFCHKKDLQKEIVSSLQFLLEIAKIYRFKPKWKLDRTPNFKKVDVRLWSQALSAINSLLNLELNESEIQFSNRLNLMAEDRLGKQWPISTLCLEPVHEEKRCQLQLVAHTSYEHVMALMLEQMQGFVPLWLMPYHVCVLVLDPRVGDQVEQWKEKWQKQGLRVFVDHTVVTLAESLTLRSSEKYEAVVLCGIQECKQDRLTVRWLKNGRVSRIAFDQLAEQILCSERQNNETVGLD